MNVSIQSYNLVADGMEFHKTFTGYIWQCCNNSRMPGMVMHINVCHFGFRYTEVTAL